MSDNNIIDGLFEEKKPAQEVVDFEAHFTNTMNDITNVIMDINARLMAVEDVIVSMQETNAGFAVAFSKHLEYFYSKDPEYLKFKAERESTGSESSSDKD